MHDHAGQADEGIKVSTANTQKRSAEGNALQERVHEAARFGVTAQRPKGGGMGAKTEPNTASYRSDLGFSSPRITRIASQATELARARERLGAESYKLFEKGTREPKALQQQPKRTRKI